MQRIPVGTHDEPCDAQKPVRLEFRGNSKIAKIAGIDGLRKRA
jgi:hypothetical protein